MLLYHREVSDHPQAAPAPTRVGGRYVLLDELGRGGMASVYRALDEVLDRQVAVKLLHPHLAVDTAFLDRFRREARAAAALSHPNVVAVHDWGETDEGAYLILQLIEGPTLRQLLRQRGPLTAEEAASVMIPAARGLGAAHEAGLVHRDVKPENLLLGHDGTVRVTDFGLARAVASATTTFGTDILIGSPHYLSPEAVNGERLDPRADVYALGVVLFECLTGQPPHRGESAYATAVQHTSQAVPAPSTVVDGIQPGVDDVVRWATAIDRDIRYPSGGDFARALSNAVPNPTPMIALAAEVVMSPSRRHPSYERLVDEHDQTNLIDEHRRAAPDQASDPGDAFDEAAFDAHDPDEDERFDPHDLDWDDASEGYGARGGTGVVAADEHDTADVGPRHRRSGWLTAFVIVALILASGVGGYLLWDRLLVPVLPIPAVVGAQQAAAEQQLQDDGFVPEVAASRHDLDAPAGTVLEQDPSGTARRGTEVALVVSDGPRQIEVPDVLEQPRDEAIASLEADGFEVATEEVFDETIPAERVVAMDPAPGAIIDETSRVTLTISRGPRPIEIPAVVGEPLETAGEILREADLNLEVGERRYDDEVPRGHVLEQSPTAGSLGARDDTVDVAVSDGPAPIEVPSVRDQPVAEAVETLRGLGFEVEVDRRGGLGAFLRPGEVFDQDPGPGSSRFPGDVITLFAYND